MLVDAIRAEGFRLSKNRTALFWSVLFVPIIAVAIGALTNLVLKGSETKLMVNGKAPAELTQMMASSPLAIMGVGGGFIMVPVMVYMLRMPMHVVVGTSLFQILFTCINVTVMQSITNHNVDLVLAVILLVGSTLGAQIGAKMSRRLHADQLKILLASIVLVVMLQILVSLILSPAHLLAYKGGH